VKKELNACNSTFQSCGWVTEANIRTHMLKECSKNEFLFFQ
jgi:hypothetical protein